MNLATCDRVIEAPVDVVWPLLSSAEGLNQWMSIEAEVDLRPGGAIRWTHDSGWVVAGEIREVTPMRRLVFTFGWERGGFPVPRGSSVVTIELDALDAATRVRVRHEGLTAEMAAQHTEGWTMFIERLAARASAVST
ncbi:MAG: SRPBCC domain-containing protein [Ilumatobacter sp.]|uniref:SRPBCC family protein n=1 Tax=Ilumatobacter sp. TaxID=1967498 RepID=UPI00261C4688|nr:SRPBCC domain-containing protein [Ilumatobacter sp.]MDJ0768097.1 SRPBCC domain-containing protein [Ilumatobacter sp.]